MITKKIMTITLLLTHLKITLNYKLCLLQEIQRSLKPNTDIPNDRRNRKLAVKTPDEGGYLRTTITKHFWAHGACGHHSKYCPYNLQAPGHKKDAIFYNKNGGSKASCE